MCGHLLTLKLNYTTMQNRYQFILGDLHACKNACYFHRRSEKSRTWNAVQDRQLNCILTAFILEAG